MKIGNMEINLLPTKRRQGQNRLQERIDNLERKFVNSQIKPGQFDYSGTFANTWKGSQEISVYKFIRDQISFLDAAVLKRVLLIGDFEVFGEDKATTEFLNNYKDNVRENYFGRGFINFLYQHADSALATGVALSERVNREDFSGAYTLRNAAPQQIRFIPDDKEGYILGYQTAGMPQPKVFDRPEYIYYTAFDKRYGNPQGYSLFHSLEFASQIMTRIMQSLHNTVWRIGDPTFLSITKGNKSGNTGIGAKSVSETIQTQMKEVAQSRSAGQVRDMHLYMPQDYEFEVKALGVDGMPIFDFTVNSRIVIEQLITKTHLPPYAFGFYQWNSNYRMSTDQQKLLLAAVKKDRVILEQIIYRDFGMELFLAGRNKKFWIEWDEIDLTEIAESARANHLNAAANKANSETQINLWMNGIINDNELREALERYGVIKENTDSQKILDSLESFRKLSLLNIVSREALREKVLGDANEKT